VTCVSALINKRRTVQQQKPKNWSPTEIIKIRLNIVPVQKQSHIQLNKLSITTKIQVICLKHYVSGNDGKQTRYMQSVATGEKHTVSS